MAALGALALACPGGTPIPVSCPVEDVAPPVTQGAWYRPGVSTTWQWQLSGAVNTAYAVDAYDIDLFDAPADLIASLHAEGRKVICYFSAGSSEEWRSDFAAFQAGDMGEPLDGWEGERWLDVCSPNVLEIMLARLVLAVSKGCDGVEPDNVDGFDNESGFALTAAHQLRYNRRIANEAHARGLAVALKNDAAQVDDLLAYYDLAVVEECHAFEECSDYLDFVAASKPVFNAEYGSKWVDDPAARAELCASAQAEQLRTLVLPVDLDDSFRLSCD